jgi:hypothetical protein
LKALAEDIQGYLRGEGKRVEGISIWELVGGGGDERGGGHQR